VKLRYLIDLYADILPTLRISFDFPIAEPRAAKPAPMRAVPLKQAPHPEAVTGRPGTDARSRAQSLAARDPAVVQLSEETRSAIEPSINPGLDRNLQLAAGIYDALSILGVACLPSSRDNASSGSSVKLPSQTLRDRWGTDGDLSVLYCSLLTHLGVETAILTAPGRSFIAFALASGEEQARTHPALSDTLLFREGKAWVPVEVTNRGSFLEAWREGLATWREARKTARFHAVGEAGAPGESISTRGDDGEVQMPDWLELVERFQEDVASMLELATRDRERGPQ